LYSRQHCATTSLCRHAGGIVRAPWRHSDLPPIVCVNCARDAARCYEVLRWNGKPCDCVPGGAVRIAVSPDGSPWIVDDEGAVFRWLGSRWHRVIGDAVDIAFGADAELLDCRRGRRTARRTGVSLWNGREWDMTDGAANRIAVAPNGLPWLVNIRGGVYPRHVML
jgi:hypothetical protein